MAKNNSSNQDYTNNADGFDVSGGATKRKLTVTGSDIALTGSGSNTYTFPASTDTLVGRSSTDTLTNKTLTSPILVTPALGTPSALVLTNATGLVASTGTTATGTPSSSTYLRGDNTWSTPSGSGGSGITRSIISATTTVAGGATALTDYVYLLGSGAVYTQPTAVGNTNRYTIKNIDTTNKTIASTSSQTFDGGVLIISPGESVDLISNNTNWIII